MSIVENYKKAVGSVPEGVRLLAVSKNKPIEDILEVYNAGQRDFAENKIQELREKMDKLPKDISWHFIGILQTNKVKYLDENVETVQSLDRVALLKELEKNASKKGYTQTCLFEINIGREESKGGMLIEELDKMIEETEKCKNIMVKGIMAVIPKCDESNQREYFRRIREIFEDLKKKEYKNIKMEILSMGMSGDYLTAIEEGSNMVRLGRTIFGERIYPKKQIEKVKYGI